MTKEYTTLKDGELIQRFLVHKEVAAYDTLVRRYYDTLYGRFLVQVENPAEAEDLSQTLWINVLKHLPDYEDNNKFLHLLHKIATNLLRNRWRAHQSQTETTLAVETRLNALETNNNPTEEHIIQQKKIQYLTQTLIPQMPAHLRIAFLLKHESEYWDNTQPFRWEHLATLNNIDIETASQYVQKARDKLINNNHAVSKTQTEEVTIDELGIFLLWTQTQRGNKKSKVTESYLAKLMNIPVNTFKTHYRRALALLNQQLQDD